MNHLPPPQPVVTTTIRSDSTTPDPLEGIILESKCNIGYPPYSYVWIPWGAPAYYSKITIVLHQHCVVEPTKQKTEKEKRVR
jgi:hypothetical protein